MYMCKCMYNVCVYMYIYTYVCVHVFIQLYVCVYVCVCGYMHIYGPISAVCVSCISYIMCTHSMCRH